MKTYQYTLTGVDAYRRPWTSHGKVTCNLEDLMERAVMAVYAKMIGPRSCDGPYTIKHLEFDVEAEGKSDEADHVRDLR